jgi:hypothetical protein
MQVGAVNFHANLLGREGFSLTVPGIVKVAVVEFGPVI